MLIVLIMIYDDGTICDEDNVEGRDDNNDDGYSEMTMLFIYNQADDKMVVVVADMMPLMLMMMMVMKKRRRRRRISRLRVMMKIRMKVTKKLKCFGSMHELGNPHYG